MDIDLGDTASKIMYRACRETWKNREGRLGEIMVPNDDFSGIRYISVGGLSAGTVMGMNTDGVGTKIEIAERLGDHSTMAFDLLAMVCDDAVRDGAEPLLVGNILDAASLQDGIKSVKQLAGGLIKAAKTANVAVINGEMAELGGRIGGYGPFNYNWGAFVLWVREKEKLISGMDIKSGDAVVALQEKGFRSNGLSLVRNIMREQYGPDWHLEAGEVFTSRIMYPSTIYSSAILKMIGGYGDKAKVNINGIVHVTGGGVPGKLSRLLRRTGKGALLTDLFDCPDVMGSIQEMGNVSDMEAYRTWNMGQGILLISNEPEKVLEKAASSGIAAKVAGTINNEDTITIRSRGVESPDSDLVYSYNNE